MLCAVATIHTIAIQPMTNFPPITPYVFKKRRRVRGSIDRGIRDGITFDSVASVFNDRDFIGAFRMSRETFDLLLGLVESVWTRSYLKRRKRRRGTISIDIRSAITLQLLTGAKKWDLIRFFRVKSSTIDRIFDEGLAVLDKVLDFEEFPIDKQTLNDYSMDFKLSRSPMSPFNGCIGATDGLEVKIRKPVELPSAEFYCRKGFYSLAVLAMVDSHYRFTFVCCKNPGATHDLTVFRGSTLYAYIHHLKSWTRTSGLLETKRSVARSS